MILIKANDPFSRKVNAYPDRHKDISIQFQGIHRSLRLIHEYHDNEPFEISP
jgi:hypothetical protein